MRRHPNHRDRPTDAYVVAATVLVALTTFIAITMCPVIATVDADATPQSLIDLSGPTVVERGFHSAAMMPAWHDWIVTGAAWCIVAGVVGICVQMCRQYSVDRPFKPSADHR